MPKRPTIADLAKRAGVSVATVDRVLNRRHPVKNATALQVVEAAEAIGYHATGLLKQRLAEIPQRTFVFLLQKKADDFYQALAAALTDATKSSLFIHGKPVVEFTNELVPSAIAAKLREAGKFADAIATVAVDHPYVTEAIEELAAKGIPVFAILSDLTAPSRAGYLGVDSRKAGRTAGWAIARLAKEAGQVGVLVGTHRYLSQELAEISFRSYFREHAPQFQLLETIVDLDDSRIAYEATLDLLHKHKSLCGIYLAGGGMKGMIDALRDEGAGQRLIAVCNELVPATRAALIDGIIDLVLATPISILANHTIDAMTRAASGEPLKGMRQILLPADLYISENI